MRTLDPIRISHQDVLAWFGSSLQLVVRRKLPFLFVTAGFYLVLMLAIRSVSSIAAQVPAILIVSVFMIFCAMLVAIALGGLIMMAHQSDHSQSVNLNAQLATLAPAQKDLLRMALLVFFVGAFYWVAYLAISVKGSILDYCEQLLHSFSLTGAIPFEMALHLSAGLLYFTLLVLVSMRLFFSLSLMFFHDLDYNHAQQLGQRAIIMNIQPMTTMLIAWIVLLSVALKFLPWLSILLLPMLGAYSYVAYRQVFLGQKDNLAQQVVLPLKAVRVSAIH